MKYSPSNLPDGFKAFWKSYPRKVGKGAAVRAWSNNGCEEISHVIVTAVRKYPFSDDAKFIKHPATWLNSWCWEDEFEESNNETW